MRRELPRVRHLVKDQPAPQGVVGEVGAASPLLDVCLDEVKTLAANRLGAKELRIVLAEHAAPDERQHERDVVVDAGAPDLDKQRVRHAPGFENRIDGAAQDAEVQVQPSGTVESLELRQGRSPGQPTNEVEQWHAQLGCELAIAEGGGSE